jgi:integrase
VGIVALVGGGRETDAPERKARVATEALKKIDRRWHDLRHEGASRWRERGLDLEVIRRLLGHSTLLVTQRYLNINEDELVEATEQKIWKRA